MCSGNVITFEASSKACSGKCKGAGCRNAPKIWVVAACEGMISLFEKNSQGELLPKTRSNQAVFSSLDDFKQTIDQSEHDRAFDQLVIVGSSNDIAWIHASLSDQATRHIVAEIEYPLISAWFNNTANIGRLTQALENAL